MLTTPFGSIKESFLTQDLPAHCMSLINGLCLHECSDFLDSVVLGSGRVYRFSNSVRQGQLSILMHDYMLCTPFGIEQYRERIELALFTCDEMVWAFEAAEMVAQYHSEGLMGRGLYVGRFGAEAYFRAGMENFVACRNPSGRLHPIGSLLQPHLEDIRHKKSTVARVS